MTSIAVSGRTHELKSWPKEFEAVVDGTKTFEVRINDRDYQVGDVLILREWKYIRGEGDETEGEYTGRVQTALVTYVYTGKAPGDPIQLQSGRFERSGIAVMALQLEIDIG